MAITPDTIQALLDSEDMGDRLRGVNQLRQLTPDLALGMLLPLVQDANARVRYAAVSQLDTLGVVDRARAAEVLRYALLHDPEPDVQAAAADAIGGLQMTEMFPELQALYDRTGEWLVQFSIIATLGELGDPRGFGLLQTALTNDNELIQATAISSLGELGDPAALDLILPFASHGDWQMRHRVAQALGRLGGDRAQMALRDLAQDDNAHVATEAKHHLAI